MTITIRPRVVAAPWEREQLDAARPTRVGLEAEVEPEPGPVALYQSAFPDRAVRWCRERQLFEIVSTDANSGFRELVFFYDAEPESDEELTAEAIAEMVDEDAGRVVKRWAPFDYAFVQRRLRERFEFYGLGADRARKHARRIADHNANVQRTRLREQQELVSDWMRDDRRYLGELAALRAGAHPLEAKTERIPLVVPGIALSSSR